MVHTRFFDRESQARQQLQEMKNALATLVDQLPEGDDDVPDATEEAQGEFASALDEFVSRYP